MVKVRRAVTARVEAAICEVFDMEVFIAAGVAMKGQLRIESRDEDSGN